MTETKSTTREEMKLNIQKGFFFVCVCLKRGFLTGAGPRGQRGLESPGAEVGRCSLKDEGDRQGDKHGPLWTGGSAGVFLFF